MKRLIILVFIVMAVVSYCFTNNSISGDVSSYLVLTDFPELRDAQTSVSGDILDWRNMDNKIEPLEHGFYIEGNIITSVTYTTDGYGNITSKVKVYADTVIISSKNAVVIWENKWISQ